MIKGKPGFLAHLQYNQVALLLQDNPLPVETTPSNNTCMNIRGFKAYIGLLRFYDAVMKTNQYPYLETGNTEIEDDHKSHERASAKFEIVEADTQDKETMSK
jgi:hypothetical protein